MTNLPRFALSADIGQAHYFTAPILNHEPPETFEGLTWFVVVCNPKAEKKAQLGLRRAGYQTYLPMTKKWKVVSRQKQEAENPLFPRYLFLGIRPDQDFWKMQGVHGVEGVLRDGYGQPVRIPAPEQKEGEEKRPHLLARLLEREIAGEFDFTRLPDLGPQYRPGEQVRLTAGAFTDLQAEVVSMLSKGRVEVLLSFMGRGTKVRMKATELQSLQAAE